MKKYLSNKFVKISCMDSMIRALNESPDSKKQNKLIVITAQGIYSGTLKTFDDVEDLEIKDSDDIITVYRKSYLEMIDEIDKDEDNEVERVSENPISIILENVEMRSENVITNMRFVEIFIDQIIGISMGSISLDNKQN